MTSVAGDSCLEYGINMKESNTLVINVLAMLSCATFRSIIIAIRRKPIKNQKVFAWTWMGWLKEGGSIIIVKFLLIHKEWSREMP